VTYRCTDVPFTGVRKNFRTSAKKSGHGINFRTTFKISGISGGQCPGLRFSGDLLGTQPNLE